MPSQHLGAKPGGEEGQPDWWEKLTTMGWDAIVDNVVVLRVALSVGAKAVELSCREGRKEDRVCVVWLKPAPHFPTTHQGAIFPILFPDAQTKVLGRGLAGS